MTKHQLPQLASFGRSPDGISKTAALQAALMKVARQARRFRSSVSLAAYADAHAEDALSPPASAPREPADLLERQAKVATAMAEVALFSDWSTFAVEGAIMTLFHFVKAVEVTKAEYAKLDELHTALKPKDLKDAVRSLEKAFPGAEAMRDWVAHQAEVSLLDSFKNSRLAHGDLKTQFFGMANCTNVLVGGNRIGDTVEYVVGNKTYALAVNADSADKIDAFAAALFNEIRKLEPVSRDVANRERGLSLGR